MRLIPFLSGAATIGVILAASASPAAGQRGFPTITGRSFSGGGAAVTVTGVDQFAQEIALNTQASFGDGEMTWLQFGVSGSDAPNALITYGNREVGITVGRGKFTATAGITPGEVPQCSGGADVDGESVAGHYTCHGVVSYDAATGTMGKVDIDIRFSAES
jgi:hypothetical protein